MNLDLKQMINWFVLRGVLFILFALAMAIFYKQIIIITLAAIGVYIIIISIKFISDSFTKSVTRLDKWAFVEVILSIALGVLLVLRGNNVLEVVGIIIGAFAIVAAVLQIVFGFMSVGKLRTYAFISGALSFILGILLIQAKAIGIAAFLGFIIGFYLFVLGIIFLVLAMYFRNMKKSMENNAIIER